MASSLSKLGVTDAICLCNKPITMLKYDLKVAYLTHVYNTHIQIVFTEMYR